MLKKRDVLIYCIITFLIIMFNGSLSYGVTGTPGSTVNVTYSINSPDGGNLSTVTGKIDYDDKVLELVSVSSSAGISGNGRVSATESQINGKSMSVTATYRIKSGTENTTASTKLSVSELYTNSSENNHPTSVVGNVTVKAASNPTPNTTTNTGNQQTQNTSGTTQTSNSSSNTPKEVTFKNTNETMYTTNRVNLRTQYGTKGSIVKTLSEGEQLTRTGYSTTNVDGYSWSRVTYNGGTYYCVTKSLTATKPEKTEQDDQNTTNEIAENTTNEEVNEVTENSDSEAINADITQLEIVGYTLSPSFDPSVYEYSLTIPEDVESVDVKAQAANDNVQIEIAGNTELKDEENVITVICYNKDNNNSTTYQIMVNKQAAENPHADAIVEAKQKRNLIIKIGVAIIIILIILCIIVFKKSKEEELKAEEEARRLRMKKLKEKESSDERKKRMQQKNSNIEQKRDGRPRNLDENNIQARRERQNINNDENRMARMQERRVSEQGAQRPQKAQKDRDEEFDEKLEKIRKRQMRQEKGGKHF